MRVCWTEFVLALGRMPHIECDNSVSIQTVTVLYKIYTFFHTFNLKKLIDYLKNIFQRIISLEDNPIDLDQRHVINNQMYFLFYVVSHVEDVE